MMNVDPSGMSWLSKLFHHVDHALSVDWDHLRHQADVNWDNGRKDVEVGAAVVACIIIDIYAPELTGETNSFIGSMTGTTGTVTQTTFMEVSHAVVGGATGGAIGGTWKSAAQGIAAGYCLGMGFDCIDAGIAAGDASANAGAGFWNGFFNQSSFGFNAEFNSDMASIFSPSRDIGNFGMKLLGGGIMGEAFGQGGTPWNNFRDGMELGACMGAIGYGFPASQGSLIYAATQGMGAYGYSVLAGKAASYTSPLMNGIGWGIFGNIPFLSQ